MEPWPTALVLCIIPPTASGMNGAARRQPLFFLMRTAFGGSLLTLGSFLADFGSSQLILGDRSISLGVAHVDVREFLHRRWEFLH